MGAASNPERVKQLERDAENARALELADMTALLGIPEGRRFLWRLIGDCGLFAELWRTSSEKDYLLGRRAIAVKYFDEICGLDPFYFSTMLHEAQQQRERVAQRATANQEIDSDD